MFCSDKKCIQLVKPEHLQHTGIKPVCIVEQGRNTTH